MLEHNQCSIDSTASIVLTHKNWIGVRHDEDVVILLPPFSLKKQLYSASCSQTKAGLFLLQQETLLSLLPCASLALLCIHFSVCVLIPEASGQIME